jgi:aquaporin Z
MAVILVVEHKKGLRGFGVIVGLDIFFLAFISGASMNPERSLAPAIVSGVLANLWLYWTATFVGTLIIAIAYRKKPTSNFIYFCSRYFLNQKQHAKQHL